MKIRSLLRGPAISALQENSFGRISASFHQRIKHTPVGSFGSADLKELQHFKYALKTILSAKQVFELKQ